MRNKGVAAVGMACAVALVAAGCGSDDGGGSGGGAGGGASTIKVGLMTALSGPGAAAAAAAVRGAEARFAAYEEDGKGCAGDLDFELVEADDASSAQGALSGAQKLVQQDEVYGMLTISAFFYGASPWLTTQGKTTPVIGGAWDGAKEWASTDDNLFNSAFVPDYSVVYSTAGDYLKTQGATKVAGIAYVSPSSQAGLENGLKGIKAAGLDIGYTNNSVPFGSTDVGPLVLGIIESGADALYLTINPDTAFAVVGGLKQANYPLKAIMAPTGYGADLLESAPAVQAGQGVTFSTAITPIETPNAGTERLQKALIDHTDNESGIPGFYESQGWLTSDLFLYGLEEAGCDASQADYIKKMQQSEDWDANGLYPNPVPQTTTKYDEQCTFYVKLDGEGFVPVEDAQPLCGTPIN
jgi:ABC-type branched-subunit amino acid transport system substrate-binding protein